MNPDLLAFQTAYGPVSFLAQSIMVLAANKLAGFEFGYMQQAEFTPLGLPPHRRQKKVWPWHVGDLSLSPEYRRRVAAEKMANHAFYADDRFAREMRRAIMFAAAHGFF